MRKFVYGPGIDEPICMIDAADGDTVYYYHFDGLGSVVALSNIDGDVVESYSYDVFGQAGNTSDVNNPYLFTGRRYDDETGLYYYRARYYDSYTGRFLQTDPIGYWDSMNLYQYCWNNPLIWKDPYGLGVYVITGTGQAGCTVSVVRESGIVIGEGKVGWINTTGAGGGTPSAGVGLSVSVTNATSIESLSGVGFQGGMSGGMGVTGGVDVLGGGEGEDKYVGVQLTVGVGAPIPLEGHGQLTHSTVYELFDYGQIIDLYNTYIYDPMYDLGFSIGELMNSIENLYEKYIYDPLHDLGSEMGDKK